MKLKYLVAALVVAGWAGGASAVTVRTYDTASFRSLGGGTVGLDGFGRTAETLRPAVRLGALLAQTEPFFDTWNIDVSQIAAGDYTLNNMLIEAAGTLQFSLVSFNSIDEQGVRSTFLFDINTLGTQAVGNGNFTVRASCPIASCVWIDVIGTQVAGSGAAGYTDNGLTQAALVPEPATYGLMALGLAAVGFAARRRRA